MSSPIKKALASLTEEDWRSALQHHYLSTLGPYGNSDLTNLDVTLPGLADAIGINEYSDEEIQKAFMSIFTRASVRDVLGREVKEIQGARAYSNFHFLVLSCLVAATTTDVGDSSNQYRERLGALLNDNQGSEQHVDGINSLWVALKRWIDVQIEQGEHYRKIILPEDIKNRTLIGYATELAYPSRADRSQLTKILEKLSDRAFEAHGTLILELDGDYRNKLPKQMQTALSEIKQCYLRNESFENHYFWQLILSILSELNVKKIKNNTLLWSISVRFGGWDGDELEEVILAKGNRRQDLEVPFWQGSFLELLELNQTPKQVKNLLDSGCIILLRHRGLWIQDDKKPQLEDTALILANRPEIIQRFQHPYEVAKGWHYSEHMPLEAALKKTQSRGIAGENTLEKGLKLVGGIPLGRNKWLARLGYLPHIELESNSQFSSIPELKVQVEDNFVTILEANLSNEEWLLKQIDKHNKITTKRIQFLKNASLNGSWSTIKNGFEASVELDYQPGLPIVETKNLISEGVFPNRLCDALEVLYARAQVPRSGAEIITILQTVLPQQPELKYMVWDVLRSLEEAGWLEQDLNRQWRGRVWRLQAPKIVLTGELTAIVEGAVATRELELLKGEAIKKDIDIFINANLPWAAPIINLRGDKIINLAEELRWKTEIGRKIIAKPAPKCWPIENRTIMGRQLSSIWNPDLGLFVPVMRKTPSAKVLSRFTRSDDRDVYAIGDNQDFITTQRNVAILEYARRIKKPIFIYSDGLLTRQGLSGHLPLPIAQWLRRSTGIQTGPIILEKNVGYQYPVDRFQLNALQTILGFAIEGNSRIRSNNLIKDIGRQRHRGSRVSYILGKGK